MMKILPLLLLAPLGLSGCAYLAQTDGVDVAGAYQLTDRDSVEKIDLDGLLTHYAPKTLGVTSACADPSNFPRNIGNSHQAMDNEKSDAAANERHNLDKALFYFNCQAKLASEQDKQLARNALQERLLAASRQRCAAFNTNLQRTFARTNFGLGVATAVAGAAGALVNSVSLAHRYSGAAGIFSGARAEYNQDYMANLAAHVVTAGIEQRRQQIYQQIQKQGQEKIYALYPVEAAIKDALYYHGECNVLTGFQVASDSIRYVNDPGLHATLQNIARVTAVNKIIKGEPIDVNTLNTQMSTLSVNLPILAGSALVTNTQTPESYLSPYQSAMESIDIAIRDLGAAKVGAPGNQDKLEATRSACLAKLSDLSSKEAGSLAALKITPSDVKATSTAIVQAAASHSEGEYLAKQAQSLAGDYNSRAYQLISSIIQAKSAKASDTELAKLTSTQLNIDAKLLAALDSLCPAPAAAAPAAKAADAKK